MIKKTVKYFWSVRVQFSKYVFVGGSGMVIDMGLVILLKEVFDWWPVLVVIIVQGLLIAYNFTLNKYWSFKNREVPHKQLVRYLTLIAFNYSFGVLAMYIFNDLFDFDYRLVRAGTILLMGCWNFFVYKYWVYKDHDEGEKEEEMMV